jgi:hypothetical protein
VPGRDAQVRNLAEDVDLLDQAVLADLARAGRILGPGLELAALGVGPDPVETDARGGRIAGEGVGDGREVGRLRRRRRLDVRGRRRCVKLRGEEGDFAAKDGRRRRVRPATLVAASR